MGVFCLVWLRGESGSDLFVRTVYCRCIYTSFVVDSNFAQCIIVVFCTPVHTDCRIVFFVCLFYSVVV